MGAADVVPGVSGGTIAFISGIYEELIDTINSVNLSLLTTLRKQGIAAAWKQINGNFLVALLSGIALSILTLSRLITWLLQVHPILIWSFFFGLVLASIWLMGKTIKHKFSPQIILSFLAGAAGAYWITILPTADNPTSLLYIFFSGALAICAMILPGISGSFILVLLGSYLVVLEGLHTANIPLVATFIAGAVVGLLSFARLLKWLFDKYEQITIALLTGFLLGSLNKIWPWKQTLETVQRVHSDGSVDYIPVLERNLLPGSYEMLMNEPAQLWPAVGLCLLGAAIIVAIDRAAGAKSA